MPEKNQRLSPSEIKRRKRADKYFDLFGIEKPKDLSPPEKLMAIKKKKRMCKDCDPVDLVLCINGDWMCWGCKHNTMNLTKQEDDWI